MFNKIIKTNEELKKLRIKFKNKKVGLCHGVFDIVHLGHIKHFEQAKKNVDILLVSVTADKFVKKGFSQPYNNENKRVLFLSSINFIDYVFLNDFPTADSVIKLLKPNFYFKGKDYLQGDFTKNLEKEKKILRKQNGVIKFTTSKIMSSTKIINNFFLDWNKEQKEYLLNASKKYNFEQLLKIFEKIKEKEINIMGEIILDKYVYTNFVGVTSKDPAMSLIKKDSETIPGGALAVAMILSKFSKRINFYTCGKTEIFMNFLKDYKNIYIFNLDDKKNIQIKTRFINFNRFEKILQITNFKNNPTNEKIFKNLNKYKNNLKDHIMICDYGIDMFDFKVINLLENLKIKSFLNVQTNSLNYGFNLFTKYKKFNYLCLDDREWKLGIRQEELNSNLILKFVSKISKNKKYILAHTMGKNGSKIYLNNKNYYAPVFLNQTKDTTGCGDAYYAITSLLILNNVKDLNLVVFLGNLYAGIHGQYFGNKHITNRVDFLKYTKSILNF